MVVVVGQMRERRIRELEGLVWLVLRWVVDSNSTKARRSFLERRRFRCRVSCRTEVFNLWAMAQ